MKTQYYTAATLDGFIADEHHSLEWLFQFGADPEGVGDTGFADFMREVGAVAMGSNTYQWLLDHEVRPKDGPLRPWPYTQPTWVFSSREPPRVEGADVRFARGDVRPVHAEMVAAARGKNVWLVGGGDLVGQFHDQGLLDELIVSIAPVTLGRGAPLLPRRITTPPLVLRDVRAMGDAFVRIRYEVARGRAGTTDTGRDRRLPGGGGPDPRHPSD